ncbi:MAG TPA: rhomboid family intramembrane serine protease [Dysgonamonadaceae bacterium]|jgi:membrane associated rhomboid family serine protease|nr:rhomboid family intramembrane serine protease [Dysgonamonadaceae bacterium]
MADFIKTLKYKYKTGDVLRKLIFINILVFLLIKITGIFFTLFKIGDVDVLSYLAVPSEPTEWLKHFWTPITYMFVHEGFWHILFNLLWLYWFGQIFMQYFTGRTLGSLYILGGLAGALLYMIAFNTIPYYVDMGASWMIGASAAVMAIVMAAAFYRPDVRLNLFLLGRIKIIYIALFAFILDFLSLNDISNPGGHIAHIGGAIAGYIFAVQYKKGKDITLWISKLIDGLSNLFKKKKIGKKKMKVSYGRFESDSDYNYRKHKEQQEIDTILDKLKRTGYSGLTDEEKRKLFNAGNK